jgi:hypothetical protein
VLVAVKAIKVCFYRLHHLLPKIKNKRFVNGSKL